VKHFVKKLGDNEGTIAKKAEKGNAEAPQGRNDANAIWHKKRLWLKQMDVETLCQSL